jgi:hypothetical protein
VVDYTLFDFPRGFADSAEQIRRVEQLSDAYHLRVGEDEVMVAYLLEIRARPVTLAPEELPVDELRARLAVLERVPGGDRAPGGRRPAERHRRTRAGRGG